MDDAQVGQMVQGWRDALAKQLEEMRVRQWCIEQAVKALEGQSSVIRVDNETVLYPPVMMAREILAFITAPIVMP